MGRGSRVSNKAMLEAPHDRFPAWWEAGSHSETEGSYLLETSEPAGKFRATEEPTVFRD
jgi:hypothetical protein